jgi:Bacterial PH domain
MPAASDGSPVGDAAPPSLPRTWRPLGVRVAVVFFGTMLLVVCVAAWVGFDPSVRERFTGLQRMTVVLFGLLFAFVGWVLARARVTAAPDGLVVVNGLKRRELAWEEVVVVNFPPSAPWASLDLADGTEIAVMAFQASDGQRARAGVRELRALVDR